MQIPGLSIKEEYIKPDVESELCCQLDALSWTQERRGLVQNYGYLFNYQSSGIAERTHIRRVPAFLTTLCRQLVEDRILPRLPECLIVNNYQPGQGIVPHTDVLDQFGPTVSTLSLISPIKMVFIQETNRTNRFELVLPPRSLLVMEGEARFHWMHGIRPRKTDEIDGKRISRQRRISVSFRNVNPTLKCHEDTVLFEQSL